MIEIGLLVALGFLVASLLAVLFAGPFWRRAVRLTTRRIEATMPMSLADIQAEKDQIRAEYAVELRRAEIARDREKENAARFLVERNKHRVEIAELKNEIDALKAEVAERGNESTVLEQTVRKHIPELEQQLERARQIIATRDRELARMTTAYENQTEALGIAKKAIQRHSDEIERLREVLESGGAKAAKAAKGDDAETPEQENLRLQAELSRLRQQLVQFKEVEAADNAMLRSEMKKLADQMMSGKPPAKKPVVKKTAEKAAGAKTPAKQDQDGDDAAPAKKKRTRKTPARRTPARKQSPSLGERLKKLTAKADA